MVLKLLDKMRPLGYIRLVMETVQIVNVSKGTVIAQEARLAVSLGQRMKGLLGRDRLAPNEALIIKSCSSIHTFFMRFSIDVLFVDRKMRIIKVISNMPSTRLSPLVWASQMVIELPTGKINQTNTHVGDTIEIR